MRSVNIIIWNDKAFLPTLVATDAGILVHCDPVYEADLEVASLTAAIEKSLSVEHPHIRHPTRDEWPKHSHVMLTATGARSWKALSNHGIDYGLTWKEDGISLYASKPGSKGYWEPDPDRSHEFGLSTPLPDIAAVILNDVNSRSSE